MAEILVFTRTADYRHDSIPYAVDTLRRLGLDVRHTEDPAAFEEPLTGRCDAVVFLSTSGDVLTPKARAGLAAYVDGGGGFVGVHAAACTEYGWPYYGSLLGARFRDHPAYQPGRVRVTDRTHPATRHLGESWEFSDEWYDFRADPRADPTLRVLAHVDEASYDGGGMGLDDGAHPVAWCREAAVGRGRVFYTSFGHARDAYDDPAFRTHLLGGIEWAASRRSRAR